MVDMMKFKILFLIVALIGIMILCLGVKSAFFDQKNVSLEEVKLEGEDAMDENSSVIHLEVNGEVFEVTLIENETTLEILKRIPLDIVMNELNGNEKYYYFDEDFPSNPRFVREIHAGDLMLYGDDCLVLFYEDFSTSYSYTKIGEIKDVSCLKEQLGKGSVRVLIRK